MKEPLYKVVPVKSIGPYREVKGFDTHAFYSCSAETRNVFGDAVYFVDTDWLRDADREIWGS